MICSRRTSPLPALLLVAVAVTVVVMLTAPLVPDLRVTEHSFNHPEGAEIVRCNTILEIWINRSCERLNILKLLEDGRVGNQVIQPCRYNPAILVTAYIIGGGNFEDAIRILKAKGCIKIYP